MGRRRARLRAVSRKQTHSAHGNPPARIAWRLLLCLVRFAVRGAVRQSLLGLLDRHLSVARQASVSDASVTRAREGRTCPGRGAL